MTIVALKVFAGIVDGVIIVAMVGSAIENKKNFTSSAITIVAMLINLMMMY